MKKNYLFLGFAIPDEEMAKIIEKGSYNPIETHKFVWNVIKGIEEEGLHDFTYVSARPITDYPLFPQKRIRKSHWVVDVNGKEIEITEIPFINTSVLKIFTRFVSSLFYCFQKYHQFKNKGGIIVYSVHVPFMLTGFLLSKIYKVDFIAIWTDPPSISFEKESFLKSKLRKAELRLSKSIMKKATKVIALTKYLAEDFAPGKPYLVIEGIIDKNDINSSKNYQEIQNSGPIKIAYTGSLNKRYGIENLVKGFLLIPNDNVVFEIYGRGDYEEELKKICHDHKKICYKGFVSNKEVLAIQRNADFLINARSIDSEYVKYSFPSKTLEYMLSGTPVITTLLPGIPDEYRKYVFVLEDSRPETIASRIQSLNRMSKEEIRVYGVKAQEFAASKNYQVQGKKIINFIDKKLS